MGCFYQNEILDQWVRLNRGHQEQNLWCFKLADEDLCDGKSDGNKQRWAIQKYTSLAQQLQM